MHFYDLIVYICKNIVYLQCCNSSLQHLNFSMQFAYATTISISSDSEIYKKNFHTVLYCFDIINKCLVTCISNIVFNWNEKCTVYISCIEWRSMNCYNIFYVFFERIFSTFIEVDN